MRPRLVLLGTVLAVTTAVAPSPAVAAAPPPQTALGLHVSPSVARPDATITVRGDPCPPPSSASQPVAELSLSARSVGVQLMPATITVPVETDGSWSVAVALVAPGYYGLDAACLTSPHAEGSYAAYQTTPVAVVTQSVGYWVAVGSDEAAAGFGDATAASPLQAGGRPAAAIVGVAADPATGLGYWLAAADGGVFTAGDAAFEGSAASRPLRAAIAGMAATRSGHGYWLVASDGGVFTFGDAYFQGSGVGAPDRSRVVGIAPYGFHTTRSYLLAKADGSVTEYTPDGARQLNGPLFLNAPVVGIAATPSEMGYYLVAADGGVFTFGDAQFAGSLGGIRLPGRVAGITSRNDGGYWLVGADGGVFSFGGAPFFGSNARHLSPRAVGIAATPDPLAPLQ